MKVEELINRYYGSLNENDKLICNYILGNPTGCYKLSIDEFAFQCNVSKTTLFRFAKKISLLGYSELKARLRWEIEEKQGSKTDFLTTVSDSYHKMVDDIKSRDCKIIFDRIESAGRILVYGSDYAQARVASEFKRIFLPIQKKIFHIHGSDIVHTLTKAAKAGDYVIIISLSGESRGVIQLAESLRTKQVPTLSITRMKNNSLASLCDCSLYINSIPLPTDYMLDYEISTPYFILIELLFLKYQNYLCELHSVQNSIK